MRYLFSDCVLDIQRQELHRAGEPIKLRRKVFQVLVYLLAHRERVVPKQELLDRLWPDQFVGDEALKSCIKTLRQALRERGRTPRFIHTVHGQGYRFVAAVEERHEKASAVKALLAPDTPGPAEEPPQGYTEALFPSVSTQPEQPCTLPSEQVTTSGEWPAEPGTPEAERRHLTVLVCRLVGMPDRATPLDPEALLEVAPDFHVLCAAVARRYAGHLAPDQGDGLIIYFGYPQAHEDDARRAVYTGPEIVEAIQRFNARRVHDRRQQFAVQVGIHTGVVVMSALGRGATHEPLALGRPLTIAAQVQGLAPTDTVVISPTTLRLVEGYVLTQALGAYLLDNASQPLVVSQVLQKRAIRSRFAVTLMKGLTPLVGREQEIGLLYERWAQARDGMGQVVVLSGEAGIGKSRLLQALTERLAEDVYTRLECHCSPYAQQSALYPVIEQLKHRLQWRQEITPQEKFYALEATLAPSGLALEEAVPLLAALLALPLPAPYAPLTLEPQRQKQKTLAAVLTWWLKEAERQPLCLVVEDLHWVDPSTLELLSLLIDQVPTAPVLVLLLCRPEFHPPWPPRSYLLHLALNRLSRPQAETMVAHLTGGKALPAEVHRQLVATTDGVPLFVEELTRMVLETGLVKERQGHYELTSPPPSVVIPATLRDSLMARLDRLSAGKRIAQLGAVIGRQFVYGLLLAVAHWDEDSLQRALRELVEAELLYQRSYPPNATYLFKHALIQEAAYQSLLQSTRQQYHQRIAQELTAYFPETVENQPELLAHHYTEAGLGEQAVVWWQRAGQRAVQRSAQTEAIRHLTKGIELLPTLSDTPKRMQHELALQTTLGTALMAAKGYAAPDVVQAYSRAQALCQQVGETVQLFPILAGLRRFFQMRGEGQMARESAEQLLTLAQRQNDVVLRVVAHQGLGEKLFFLGELTAAHAHLVQGIALYDHQQHYSLSSRYGSNAGISCLAWDSQALALLGYADQALARGHKALTFAQEPPHPSSLVLALYSTARLHEFRRQAPETQERTERLIALAAEQGFSLWVAMGTILRGWALAMQGQMDEGLTQLHQGVAAWQATGASPRTSLLAQLAEAYAHAGRPEAGLHVLAEALTLQERFYTAELYRLKGEFLLRQAAPDPAQAATCFGQALDVARRQQARLWELRAAMSLSRLWQRQGKGAEAHDLLAPIYGWFTEGFDTTDLQEARALLEKLA